MSYANFDDTGGGYIPPPPDDTTNPNTDAGGFFGPADATPVEDQRPEKAFWDAQGSSEPASKASFWDDQGSSTPAPSDQPGFTPEAGTKKKSDFWDNAVAPSPAPAPPASTPDSPAFGLGTDTGTSIAGPGTDFGGAGAPFGTQPVTDAERQATADVPGGDLSAGFGPYQTTETERKATQAFVNYNSANDDLQQASDSFNAKYAPGQFDQLFGSLNGEGDKLGKDMQSYVDYVNSGGYYDAGVWQGLLDKKQNLDARVADAQQQAAGRYGPDGQATGQYADDLNALLALEGKLKAAGIGVDQAGDQLKLAQLSALANAPGADDATSRLAAQAAERLRGQIAEQQQIEQQIASAAFAQRAGQFTMENDTQLPLQGPPAPDAAKLAELDPANIPLPSPDNPVAVESQFRQMYPNQGVYSQLYNADGSVNTTLAADYLDRARQKLQLDWKDYVTTHQELWPSNMGWGYLGDIAMGALSAQNLIPNMASRGVGIITSGANQAGQLASQGEYGAAIQRYGRTYLDFLQHLPYIATNTNRFSGWSPDQYAAQNIISANPLGPITPGGWQNLHGGEAGGFNTPVLGGLDRAFQFTNSLFKGGEGFNPKNWTGSATDPVALADDLRNGMSIADAQKLYRGNVGVQVLWDLFNPANFIGVPGVGEAIKNVHAVSYGRLEGRFAEPVGKFLRSANTAESIWHAADEPVLASSLAKLTGGRTADEVGQILLDRNAGQRLPAGLNAPQTQDMLARLQRGIDRIAAARGVDRTAAVQSLFSEGTWDNVLRQWAADSGVQGVDAVEAYVLQHRGEAMDNMLGNIIKNEARLDYGGTGTANLAAVQHAAEMAIANKERAIRIANDVGATQGLAPRGAITDAERAAIIQRFAERPPTLATAADRARFLGDTALGSARAGWLALSPKYELANYAGNWFNALYEGALTPTAQLPFIGKAASEIGRFSPIEYPLNMLRRYGQEPNIGSSFNEAVLAAGRQPEGRLARPGELAPMTIESPVKRNAFQQAGGQFAEQMARAGEQAGRFGQAINAPRAAMGSLVRLLKPVAEDQSRYALHHVDFHQAMARRAAEIVANAYDRWGGTPDGRALIDGLVSYINDGHVHPDEIAQYLQTSGGFRGVAPPRVEEPGVPPSGMARGRPSGGPQGSRGPRGPNLPDPTPLNPYLPESTLERFASNMGYWEQKGTTNVLESELNGAATDAANKLNIDLPPKATNSDLMAALREKLPGKDLTAERIRDTFGGGTPTPSVQTAVGRDLGTSAGAGIGQPPPSAPLAPWEMTRGEYNAAQPVGQMADYSRQPYLNARALMASDQGAAVTAQARQLAEQGRTAREFEKQIVGTEGEATLLRNGTTPRAFYDSVRNASGLDFGPGYIRTLGKGANVGLSEDTHLPAVLDAITSGQSVPERVIQPYLDAIAAERARGVAIPSEVQQAEQTLRGALGGAGANTPTGTHAEGAPLGAFGDQLKASRDAAAERLRQKWTTSGIVAPHADIQDLKDLAVIAAEVLYRGYANVSQFTDEFRRVLARDFKVPIPENIDYAKLHALAQKQLDGQLKLTKGQGITGLDSLHELFRQGAHGAGWYDNAVEAIWGLFGNDAPLFTAMIAMTSSNATPYENLLKALKAYRDIKTTGQVFGGTGERLFPDVARSLNDILAGTRIGTGEWKTNVFNLNNLGNTERVTVDRWMLRALGFPMDKVQNWGNWLFAEQVYRGIAEQLGVNPRQVQAAIWTAVHPVIGNPLNEYGYGEMLREFARSGALDWMAKVDDPAVRAGYERAMADAAVHPLPPGGGVPWSPLTPNEYSGRGSVPGGTLGISPTAERERTIGERLSTDAAWPRPIDVRVFGPNGEPLVYSQGGALAHPSVVSPIGGFNPTVGPTESRTGPPQFPPHIQAMVDERQRTLTSARAYTSSAKERAVLRAAGEKFTTPDLATSQSLQAREAALQSAIAARNAPLGITYRFDPKIVAQDIRDYAQWGALRIARAAVDFAAWSKEMIGRFTDPGSRTPQQIDHFNTEVRPNLQAIYDEASRAVKENDVSNRTRGQRLNDAALGPAAQHLQDIVENPDSYRNVLDTLAARRDTMSRTAFIKELKSYGSATGVHMGSATGDLAATFQKFREGLAELRVQVDPSYKSTEAQAARSRLATAASREQGAGRSQPLTGEVMPFRAPAREYPPLPQTPGGLVSGAAQYEDYAGSRLQAELRAEQRAAEGKPPLGQFAPGELPPANTVQPAYTLTRAGGPQPRQITRPLGNVPADELAARARDAALEHQYRVSEFNRLFQPASGPVTDFGAPATLGEATTGPAREAAASTRMYRGAQGLREGPGYRGALPARPDYSAPNTPWELRFLGAGELPPPPPPPAGWHELPGGGVMMPGRPPGPDFGPSAEVMAGQRSNLPQPPGVPQGPAFTTFAGPARIGGPGERPVSLGAMGGPGPTPHGPTLEEMAGARSRVDYSPLMAQQQAALAEMLGTIPNQWRQAIAHSNADAFMNSVRVFNNYGLQLRGVNKALGALSPFFQYQIKTPLYWASVAARTPGLVGGIQRATQDVRQANAEDNITKRNAAMNKVYLGGKWGVDLRDLIPLTRVYDALFNRANISDQGAVMRQDPISQGVRNYLESGVSFGMWPWASAALQAAGVTHPPLENMTEPPATNWLGDAAQAVGLPREVGSFVGSVLNPGDSGEQAFRAGLQHLAPVEGRLPANAQTFLQSTFPNGLEENNGLAQSYAGWFLRQMVDQGVTDADSAQNAANNRSGPVWDEAMNRVKQWSQDGYNASMGFPGRVGQLLPGEREGKKPVYRETNPGPFRYLRGAGEGGRDAGIRYPVKDDNGDQVITDGAPQYYAPQPGAPANALDVLYDRSIPDYAPEKQAAARYLRDNNVGIADKEMNGTPSEHATAEAQRHRDNAINFVLEHNAPYTNAYNRRAGEGGTDAGTGEISNAGFYYIQPSADEQYSTAKAQLNPQELNPQTARLSDYARDFLKGQGAPDVESNGVPSEQRTTAAYQRFQAQQVESDINTGRYLSPAQRSGLIDYRQAQDAYAGVPMKDPGTGQTVLVKDFLQSSGYYNLLDQAAQQRDQGDTAGLARTQGQLNWISSVPQVADYLAATRAAGARDQIPLVNLRRDDALLNPDTQAALAPLRKGFEFIGDNGERIQTHGQSLDPRDQGSFGVRRDRILYDQLTDSERSAYQAWNDWKSSPDGQRYEDLQAQQRAAGPFGSAAEKAWFKEHQGEVVPATNTRNAAIKQIAKDTGENPVSVANKVGGGLYPDFKPSSTAPKDLTVYPTSGGGGGSSTRYSSSRSSSRGGSSATGLAIEARKTFFDAFDSLSQNEKAAAHNVSALDSALAKGSRLSAEQWGTALETLQRELPNIRDRQKASDDFYQFYDGLSTSEKSAIRDLMSFDRKTATADDWRRTLQQAQDRLSGAQGYDTGTTRGAVRTTRGAPYSAFYDQRSADSPVALPVDLVERFGWAGAKKVLSSRSREAAANGSRRTA